MWNELVAEYEGSVVHLAQVDCNVYGGTSHPATVASSGVCR